MSFDLAVWHSPRALTRKAAEKIYLALCDEERAEGVTPSPSLAAFAKDLEAKSSDQVIEDWPPTPTDNAFLILNLSWSSVKKAVPLVLKLAAKHGLICYDPQNDEVHHPPKLQSSIPADDQPRPRESFFQCCQEIGRALAKSGFTYGQDVGPHADRRRGPVEEIVGFTWNPTEDGAEFRMTLSIHCKEMLRWGDEQKKRDARLPLGRRAVVASLDYRQLKPTHELFGWDLKTAADWNRVLQEAVALILTQGARYSAVYESPARIVDRLRQEDVPGLRIADALEFSLALGGRELATSLLEGFLARRSDLRPFFDEAVRIIRGGGVVPGSCPRDALDMALAAHWYGLG